MVGIHKHSSNYQCTKLILYTDNDRAPMMAISHKALYLLQMVN